MPLKYLNRNNNSSVISAGNSVLFNGSNQYLSIPNNAAFQLGTGDFTAECWTYATSMPQSFARLLSVAGTYGGSNVGLEINISTSAAPVNSIEFTINGNNTTYFRISTNSAISINTWYHVAVTRLSGTIYCFLNGVLQTSSTSGASTNINGAGGVTIAAGIGGGGYWPGYVSNVRILKGTALYTASFTAPTSPLTTVASCSLLTCQSPTIVDNSGNNFTITNNNTATVSSTITPFTAVLAAPSGVRFLNRSNVPTVSGTQNAIFGYGNSGAITAITNLVNNTGVVSNDTTGVGTAREYIAATGYGADKAIFGYGANGVADLSMTNLVSNTGVVATDTTGVGTSRSLLAAARYSTDKAIFGYGFNGSHLSMTNLVSNTGVVATDTTGVGTSRRLLAAAGYGTDKAIFGYGYNGSNVSMTNLVSNTGVVSTDTTGVGTIRRSLAAASYGTDKAIFGYGYVASDPGVSVTNLVSNTGVVATDTAGVGSARYLLAAAGYGSDKAIFGYGTTGTFTAISNKVGNTGVVSTDTTGVGTARQGLAAAGYSTSAPVIISTMRVKKIYADPAALITNGLVLNLDAGNTNSYPGSGTSWYNLNGNNTGSLINGPTYNNANGGSIVFDGSNDYVSIPNSSSLNPANITVSAWINRAGAVYYSHFIGLPVSDSAWSPPYMSYGIEYIGTSDVMSFSLGFSDSSFAYTNATAFGNNQWFQFIGTYDGANVKVYLNGAIQTTRAETKTMAASSANFYIGSNNTSTGYPLNGKIGSVQVYNRALSASEVLQNYDVTKTRFGL